MKVTIIGAGPGGPEWLSRAALEALSGADLVIGAQRLLTALPEAVTAPRRAGVTPPEITGLIGEYAEQGGAGLICLLVSGDSGFYSGSKRLLPLLAGHEVEVLPGVSSLQLLAARLGRPWQDWRLASAHGRDCCAAALVRDNAETFFLTGGPQTAQQICRDLTAAGLGHCAAYVGERLGSQEGRVYSGSVAELAGEQSDALAVLLVENPAPRRLVSCGLPDEAFTRGNVPMTKSEVRAVALSKLRLTAADIVYDVGAGTGSLAVEAALTARQGHVYAIEREEEGCRLIAANALSLQAANLSVVAGEAPAALSGLPAPDAAFIGGSGGQLRQIIKELLRLNPAVRLTIAAVTLETLAVATAVLAELPVREVEIVQIGVSRARQLGGHHLLTAQNPVFLISGVGGHE